MFKDQTPTIDSSRNIIQDVVSTLIITISLHFVRYVSFMKIKMINFLCKKLSDFQWYENIFLTRVMFREDSNQPFYKEKFLARLPIFQGEKVQNKPNRKT